MSKAIGIIGCGWLGMPLAKTLLEDNHKVNGTTTTSEKLSVLSQEGITAFMISLSEEGINGPIADFLKDVEVLVINVPPKLRGGNKENYVEKMQLLFNAIKESSVEKAIFVSSTSVYGDIKGEVTEKTAPRPNTESGRQLLASEAIFRNDEKLQSTVVRFGGLIGPERHPITMLSGRKGLSNGNDPINLIHLNDCIHIIRSIIKFGWWKETINGVYSYHPPKHRYYASQAIKRGLQVPEYEANNSKNGKIVRANTLLNVKNFRFTTTLS